MFIGSFVFLLYRWFSIFGKNVSRRTEFKNESKRESQFHINQLDEFDDGLGDDENGTGNVFTSLDDRCGVTGPIKLSTAWARKAQSKFGLLEDRKSNRVILRQFLTREMRTAGVRQTDCDRAIDLTIELAFIPTRRHIAIRELGRSLAVVERQRDLAGGFWYIGSFLGLPCPRWEPERIEKA